MSLARLRRLIGRLFCLFAGLGLIAGVGSGAAIAAPPVALSGAFDQWGNAAALARFGAWRGARATVAEDYLSYDAWSSVAQPGSLLADWSSFRNQGGHMILSVPMLVSGQPGSLAEGASGAFDRSFRALGRSLVDRGYGRATLRLGWEFDQAWAPWSVRVGSTSMGARAYVADWRHLVTLLRSIPGAHFTFDWTVTPGYTALAPTSAYPGDAYVNYVGMDIYDRGWAPNGGPIGNPAARWHQLTGQAEGLDFWSAFARRHRKRLGVGEWGLWNDLASNGGGDDPYFIRQMYRWFQVNHVAYESYFNADGDVINARSDPRAAGEYRRLWSAEPPLARTRRSGRSTSRTTTVGAGRGAG